MDNSITFDRFFFQLAQENYEVCYSILSDDSQISRTEDRILRSVIYIDMLYYNFTQASNDDDSCISLMKELLNDLKNSIQIAENPLFYELQTIIDVKISLFLIYKELIGADYSISLDLNRRFEGLLKKLSHLQNYEVMPYKENLVFEITALQNLILGFKSLSTFNYMGTILSLTQAHSSIQQWEKVFILKKFSPTDTSNSKNASNELHKYLQRVLHCVIAKATLYFNLNLSNMHKVELLEFGNEYITRVHTKCAELKIHYLALYMDSTDFQAYKNFMEGGYRCLREPMIVQQPLDKFIPVYEYRWRPEELPSAAITNSVNSLENEFPGLQASKNRAIGELHNSLDVYTHLAKIDTSLYLLSAHAYAVRRPKNEKLKISEFINQLSYQLKNFG